MIASQLGPSHHRIYGDGKQVRDILFVDDLLDAYDAAFAAGDEAVGKAFNIGGGPENVLSLLELLAYIEKRQGRKLPLRFADWRPGDQKVFVSDIRRSQAELGWTPRTDCIAGWSCSMIGSAQNHGLVCRARRGRGMTTALHEQASRSSSSVLTPSKPRLKVLHVGKFYPPHMGGIETHLQALCGELQRPLDLRVIVSSEDRQAVEETLDGVRVSRVPTRLTLASTPLCPGMVRLIGASSVDLIHIHLPNPTAVLAYLASGQVAPLVVTYHSDTVRQKVLGPLFSTLPAPGAEPRFGHHCHFAGLPAHVPRFGPSPRSLPRHPLRHCRGSVRPGRS